MKALTKTKKRLDLINNKKDRKKIINDKFAKRRKRRILIIDIGFEESTNYKLKYPDFETHGQTKL